MPRMPQSVKELFAETISTFILIVFGNGSVAQYVLSGGGAGTFLSVNFSWGMGVTFGCYWAGGISGAHMNPAVSLAFAATRRLPWRKLPVYIAGQMIGAFVASACVYGIYYDALYHFDGGTRQVVGSKATAGIFATYPQDFVSNWTAFFDQVFGTAILVGSIFAVVDKKNNAVDKGLAPLIIGFIVFAIGMTFGFNCGYAINPARDLAPRIFTAIAGWGSEVFTAHDYWSWIPVVACLLGGLLGAATYIGLIEMHHDSDEVSFEADNQPPPHVHAVNGNGSQRSTKV